jgi:predicted metalloprotease
MVKAFGRGGATLAILTLITACTGGGPTAAPFTLPPVTLPPVTLPPVTLPPVTLPPSVAPSCGQSLDNCYSHDQMQKFADLSIGLVERFYDATYKQMPHPNGFIFIADGTTTPACGETLLDTAYEYCSADEEIYLGQETEWMLYKDFGSIGPVVALAHEWGHHAQFSVGIPQPATNAESIQHENQADCMAGAWAAWAADPSQNYLEYPKDLENIAALMTAIASAEGPSRDHGTTAQRERSFSLGFGGSVSACNAYYPNQYIYGAP